ncbi:serotransferrin-like [Polyodon spathula]|uniref:serotransferrin-like n=1 Tax=Polyodon spathula TaxID=7913 RepID=UPI001B7DBCF4|nr:serotransferrin-like [Polyodon spathula]
MNLLFRALLLLGLTAYSFAAPAVDSVRWCNKSPQEQRKCEALKAATGHFTCLEKKDTLQCIEAIKNGMADAITLDGGDIYEASLTNHDLHPIIAEDYGETTSDTCYYAVAVVKKGSGFSFRDLKGKKSCHTGLGKSAGWNIAIGTLLSEKILEWDGPETEQIETAVSRFFSASCVPGAAKDLYPKLCELCVNCARSHSEPYYDYEGAFKCLKDGKGEVAFVKHLTVKDANPSDYELLCKDGSRKELSDYLSCYLGRVPGHAVVTRSDKDLAHKIWQHLEAAKSTFPNLFKSSEYGGKNLMFKDSTKKLVLAPDNMNAYLYLGAEYMHIIQALKKKEPSSTPTDPVKWCAVGKKETEKCDAWSINTCTTTECDKGKIKCISAVSVDDCIEKIMKKEADAVAMDGGYVYRAGQCGLVPVMAENYDEEACSSSAPAQGSYYAVAVVKKDSPLTWDSLQGTKSCHTGLGRTAGWNIPMGTLKRTVIKDCDFTKFFSQSCVPGANKTSSLCSLCAGDKKTTIGGDHSKCLENDSESYYGYAGALRCLIEGGDVAFVKHTTVFDNTEGRNIPTWAKGYKPSDFKLLCYNSVRKTASPSEYKECNLARVPAHAVMTRPESRDVVVSLLKEQQTQFGSSQTDADAFKLFKSETKDLLFKDSTKCLTEVRAGTTVKDFLGREYYDSVTGLSACLPSELQQACTFHTCKLT